MAKAKEKLTDESWRKVFSIRCRLKQGQSVPPADLKLCERARREDLDRYGALEADVFDATVPFGSTTKAKR
jgi:hypothetical protein